jgi:Tfp pilus assembly protein PilF
MRRAVLCALAACAAPHHPAEPHPDVRAEVRAAEDAERARRHDLARARYEHAIADAKDPESEGYARGRFGETLLTWGEDREGTAQLEASVAAYPDDPAPWHDLGLVREQAGDLQGAVDAFQHAEKLAPTDWRPRTSLAELRWNLATRCFKAAPPHDRCAALVEATRAEYRALLELGLPDRLRTKVQWALEQLDRPYAGLRPEVVGQPAAPAPPS